MRIRPLSSLRRMSIGLTGLLLLAHCASIQVEVDYDPEEDFSPYRVYAWLPEGPVPAGDVRVDNELIANMVIAAMERNLREWGFEKAQEGVKPDFYVNYALSLQARLDTYAVNRGYVDHYGWSLSVPETGIRTYDQGTLIIDVADARDKELVWRGVGSTRTAAESTNETATQAIDETVAEILKRFPPGM